MTKVYQVQVKYPEACYWMADNRVGCWVVPRNGANAIQRYPSRAKAALTRYRNGSQRIHEKIRPEYRLVVLEGEWKEVGDLR